VRVDSYMMHVAQDLRTSVGEMVDVELVRAAAQLARGLCLDGRSAPSHVCGAVAVAVLPGFALAVASVDGARLELWASGFGAHVDARHAGGV
jgi:hypothetical protein